MIRVMAIDDNPLMLWAVVEELESQPDIQAIGTGDQARSCTPWCGKSARRSLTLGRQS